MAKKNSFSDPHWIYINAAPDPDPDPGFAIILGI
jgi:hypothetical protein